MQSYKDDFDPYASIDLGAPLSSRIRSLDSSTKEFNHNDIIEDDFNDDFEVEEDNEIVDDDAFSDQSPKLRVVDLDEYDDEEFEDYDDHISESMNPVSAEIESLHRPIVSTPSVEEILSVVAAPQVAVMSESHLSVEIQPVLVVSSNERVNAAAVMQSAENTEPYRIENITKQPVEKSTETSELRFEKNLHYPPVASSFAVETALRVIDDCMRDQVAFLKEQARMHEEFFQASLRVLEPAVPSKPLPRKPKEDKRRQTDKGVGGGRHTRYREILRGIRREEVNGV